MKTGISLRREVSDLPLSRFPLRGKAGAGGFPPTPRHVPRQQKALARPMQRLPPQEGLRPLVYPPLFPSGLQLQPCRNAHDKVKLWLVLTTLSLAGFQVTTIGRF